MATGGPVQVGAAEDAGIGVEEGVSGGESAARDGVAEIGKLPLCCFRGEFAMERLRDQRTCAQ